MIYLLVLILSIASGLLYRAGGMGKPFNTRYRDIGCSLAALSVLWIWQGFYLDLWWRYIIIFGLSWGALSTYWDFLFKKDNFYMHGFMLGVAWLPLLPIVPWYLILGRAAILGVTFGLLNLFVNKKYRPKNVFIEEFTRGFLYAATICLF